MALAFYSAVVGIFVLGVSTVLRSVAGTLGFSPLMLLVLPMAFQGSGVELLLLANYFPGPAGMALLRGRRPGLLTPCRGCHPGRLVHGLSDRRDCSLRPEGRPLAMTAVRFT